MKQQLTALLICTSLATTVQAQKNQSTAKLNTDSILFSAVNYRSIGPFRGGRSCAATGITSDDNTYYMGATGGGVWRTVDGGNNWNNISDKYFGGSIGSVAVSQSDNDVIYVGEGEETIRSNVSEGFGIWKSTDRGNTWKFCGLKDTRHITRIRIHPKNPDVVYVAALGHLFGKNKERGVYRTTDGGTTWKNILFINDSVGAIDLIMDPVNPQLLYASTWNVKRTGYSLESGGPGSAIYKSIDGGNTWKDISKNEGLPAGPLGIITVAISPVTPERIFLVVEAKDGGLFRSDDGGETFTNVNSENKIRQRAWYFSRVYADTKDPNIVYVVNVQLEKSTDGGKTFKVINTPHGDHHDLWINPKDNKKIVVADDGGAQVTVDGGANWSTYYNQPTAQFYRVTTDNHFPYRIYGAQQDNSSIRILNRTQSDAIYQNDWEVTAGGESGHHAVDPTNFDIVYGGNYGGYLERLNHQTGESRNVAIWPDSPIGWSADSSRYRFNWNFPMFFSPHNPKKLYAASNQLFYTLNEGESWQACSPDLTRHDPATLRASGGMITKDNTTAEYYATIFATCESPYEKDLLWCGSDDGVLNVSKDGGKNWTDVTPTDMPKWIMINSVEPDPFIKGGLYIAATNFKNDDYAPYLYHTKDYGKSWTKIVNGINPMHFTRVVRADKTRQGLLYAGTEFGMYISFNDGQTWKPFRLNMPIVSITDLAIKNTDLIVATQGRSFYVMNDITVLQQLNDSIIDKNCFLFKPCDTWRMYSSRNEKVANAGINPIPGVVVNYYLKAKADSSTIIKVVFMNDKDSIIKTYASNSDKPELKLKTKAGMNTINWDLFYPEAEKFEGMITWSGNGGRPFAAPGNYFVKLVVGTDSVTQPFKLIKPTNVDASDADLQAQTEFLLKCRDKLTETNNAVANIRNLRKQLNDAIEKANNSIPDSSLKQLKVLNDSINKLITSVEEAMYQTKAKAEQDFLNYPVQLNDKLSDLMNTASQGNTKPSKQVVEFYNEIAMKIDVQLLKLKKVNDNEIAYFNTLVNNNKVPSVKLKK